MAMLNNQRVYIMGKTMLSCWIFLSTNPVARRTARQNCAWVVFNVTYDRTRWRGATEGQKRRGKAIFIQPEVGEIQATSTLW